MNIKCMIYSFPLMNINGIVVIILISDTISILKAKGNLMYYQIKYWFMALFEKMS